MQEAGIRQARQNLSGLIDEVRKGHEVTITDRGKPVARLVPPRPAETRSFGGRAAFRSGITVLGEPLSSTIISDRKDKD